MKHSEHFAKVAAALARVQEHLAPVAFDSTNPDYRSRYASLGVIVATVRPILAAEELSIVQSAEFAPLGEGKALLVETVLVHSSGEWLSGTVPMPLVGRMKKGGEGLRYDPDPQAGGSAVTYGRRYGIAALLCLVADEDDDGNAASRQSSGKRQSGKDHSANGSERAQPAAPAAAAAPINAATHMPIGKEKKGLPYSEFTRPELEKAAKWCDKKGKTDWAKHIRVAATTALLGTSSKPAPKPEPKTDADRGDFAHALDGEPSGLPF